MTIELRKMREKRGLSQQELARRSGVKQPIISAIESHDTKNPTIRVLLQLCAVLRCSVYDLLTETETDNDKTA